MAHSAKSEQLDVCKRKDAKSKQACKELTSKAKTGKTKPVFPPKKTKGA